MSDPEHNKSVVIDYYQTAFGGNPDNPGRALADFFRLEDGKVVEHWDVIQDVPARAANDNGMF